MREICIPLPYLKGTEKAEVEVKIDSRNEYVTYRIESFPWVSAKTDSKSIDFLFDSKIEGLKNAIKNYDKDWELIQIFAPEKSSDHIHVLYRKRY